MINVSVINQALEVVLSVHISSSDADVSVEAWEKSLCDCISLQAFEDDTGCGFFREA